MTRNAVGRRRLGVGVGAQQLATDLLGHPAVARAAVASSAGRLRVVAYHDVPDVAVFRRHLQYLTEHFRVVCGAEVQHAWSSGGPLPPRALWLTFDDGDRSVFERAEPELTAANLSATAFVCPGVIDTEAPLWWHVVRAAAAEGFDAEVDGDTIAPGDLETRLKRCADSTRREVVARLRERVETAREAPLVGRQATRQQLRAWVAAGHEVGNHTWDHPCLDRCTPEEQRRQLTAAHAWLTEELDLTVTSFAYPNGNWAQAAEQQLRTLGYRAAVGFDHQLTRPGVDPLRLSRLRLDADAAPARTRAVLAGTQPVVMAARDRLLRSRARDPRSLPR